MPNVARFEASRVVATPGGDTAPDYRIAELWFDSQETRQATMASPEGQATVADIPTFATGGATVVIAAVDQLIASRLATSGAWPGRFGQKRHLSLAAAYCGAAVNRRESTRVMPSSPRCCASRR
jgi:hypothetical protein